MADVVNLRIARKRSKRRQEEARADVNRLAHAQSTRVGKIEAARRAKAEHNLDEHRIDTGDRR
jgi:hypothetical protein